MNLVQLGGRLGNLLFEVAFGIALAKRTGLPTRYFGALEPHILRSLEAWTGKLNWSDQADRDALIGGPGLKGRLFRSFQRYLVSPQRKRFVLQTSAAYVFWHERVVGPTFWSGYWQSRYYFESDQAEVRTSLVFRAELSQGLAELKKAADTRESVAVHIRRGDYLTSTGFGVLDQDYYRKALVSLGSTGPVLVFSDDPDWCRENLDWPVAFQVVEGGAPEEDLYLMSLCQHHIVAHSTFSWWGAWLSQRGGRTIAPDRWFPSFGEVPPLDHLYPPYWERFSVETTETR